MLDFLKHIGIRSLQVLSLFAFIFIVYWLGFKGVLGLIIGMFIMAYLTLSNNALFRYFEDIFSQVGQKETIIITKPNGEKIKVKK